MVKNSVILKIFLLLGFVSLLWAEGQKGPTSFSPITKKHSLVVPVTYPDAPHIETYPTKPYLDSVLFKAKIKQYFTDMSYGKFTYTGTVLDPVVAPNPEYKNGVYQFTRFGIVSEVGDLQVPGFDTTGYDIVVFVMMSETKNIGAWAGSSDFTINGVSYTNHKTLFMSPDLSYNPFSRGHDYGIQKGNTWNKEDREEGVINNGVTSFERTYMHELGHALGIGTHAQSRTNSDKYEYEPEVSNNDGLLDQGYGNFFCIMGKSYYSLEMNMAYRTLLGWVDNGETAILKDYGKQTVRIYPMNTTSEIRGVDIRVPYKYAAADWAHRNKGFSLEVREVTFWDSMLVHSELSENTKGIMINQHDGYTARLLDMSPSANFLVNGERVVVDIRDVVLKPGMSYSDGKVSFGNVIDHGDGSFSLDIHVVDPDVTVSVLQTGLSTVRSFSKDGVLFESNGSGTLRVFDMQGRVFFEESFEKGLQDFHWNAKGQSGFIQIIGAKKSQILKF